MSASKATSVQYNAQGQLQTVHASTAADSTVAGAKCPTCGEETTISFSEVENPLWVFMLQAVGGIAAGVALFAVHFYITPIGSLALRETAWYTTALAAPSVMLIVSLFILQLLGMYDIWVALIVWIFGLCVTIVVGKIIIKWLVGLPSIGGLVL